MLQVQVSEVAGDTPGVTVTREPGIVRLTVTTATEPERAALMARQLCTVEERDAVRAFFGVVPLAVDPTMGAWDGVFRPTVAELMEVQASSPVGS